MGDEVKVDFEPDGALRDIYIFGVGISQWEQAYAHLLSEGAAECSVDGMPISVRRTAREALRYRSGGSPLLVVERDGITYACHFFSESEIELDFLPQQVKNAADLRALTRLVAGLGRSTSRDVVVTHENGREAGILHYSVGTDQTNAVEVRGRRTRG